ncbi:MAG: adenine deaminase [Christensenellales bacterium]|jgi:adenine deaminase
MISVFQKQRMIEVAMGKRPAELVITGGKIVNVFTGEIYEADIAVSGGLICGVGNYSGGKTRGEKTLDAAGAYICPGLIDAHFHIESTRATPREVIRHALAHGNTAFIADPHEIANVLGLEGIGYMMFETENVPFGAYFAAPSCVPSSKHEDNGAVIGPADLEKLACLPRMVALGEMMDAPAVVLGGKSELEKIEAFGSKPVDGHITGTGAKDDLKTLNAYFAAGIMSNHECNDAQDAIAQLRLGAYVQVRQGSAAKNAAGLLAVIKESGVSLRRLLLCTDDKHIEDIAKRGLTVEPLRIAVEQGIDPVAAVQMATINAADAYGLRHIGAIAPGRYADLVFFSDLKDFNVEKVFYRGELVSENGSLPDVSPLNSSDYLRQTMKMRYVTEFDIKLKVGKMARIINLVPGELTTFETREKVPQISGIFKPDKKYAKLCVVERHKATGKIGLGIVKGFGISGGCIASTVAHDSHNFIAASDNDGDMLLAIDAVNRMGGGMAVVSGGEIKARMPLPIAGLMSDAPFEELKRQAEEIEAAARALGIPEGIEPFMNLSFLSLTAIGDIRLTARGLYDVKRQKFAEISPKARSIFKKHGAKAEGKKQ